MAIIRVKKQIVGFVPCYESDREMYAKIPLGEEIEIEYKKQRNPLFHKKFFAMIKLAYDNQSVFDNQDKLRKALLYEAEIFDEFISVNGESYTQIKSLSFKNMDDIEFSDVYAKVKQVIINFVGISDKEFEENILRYF